MKLNGNNNDGRHSPVPSENGSRPEKRKGGRKALRRAFVALGVIVIAVLGVVIGYSLWETPPDIPTPGSSSSPSISDPSDSGSGSQSTDSQPTDEPVDEYEGALVTERNDGIYTFLLVGRDHASNSTDTIIVGKFDTNTHTIDMVNIPRDTLINLSWSGSPKRINTVYPGYVNGGNKGIDGLLPEIRKLVGFDVDFYAVVNLKVVSDVIDAIGGVDFDLPIDMDYDDYSQSFHVHLKKGYQHLNGYEALGVFRFRYGGVVDGVQTAGYPGGDIQRIQTQQSLLISIAKQLLTLGNIPNLPNVISLCVENVETTLDASNMAFLARQFLKCSTDAISFHEMPYSNFCMINGNSLVSIDIDPWIEVINEYLNPYTEDVTRANLNILTSNYDGSYLYSTSGVIAGGIDSFYCSMCGHGHAPGGCPTSEPDEPDVSPEPSPDPQPEPDTGSDGSSSSGSTDSEAGVE